MSSSLIEIFEDAKLVNRNKLLYLFQIAELESISEKSMERSLQGAYSWR